MLWFPQVLTAASITWSGLSGTACCSFGVVSVSGHEDVCQSVLLFLESKVTQESYPRRTRLSQRGTSWSLPCQGLRLLYPVSQMLMRTPCIQRTHLTNVTCQHSCRHHPCCLCSICIHAYIPRINRHRSPQIARFIMINRPAEMRRLTCPGPHAYIKNADTPSTLAHMYKEVAVCRGACVYIFT